ncbi:MAG TPA: hypothetical protein V6D09_19350 [Leptolyngbyaceae cyanobacterium]
MLSGNDYLGALKGNQSGLLSEAKANFQPHQQQYTQENKGHGRVERRIQGICHASNEIRDMPYLKTLIRVESYRETIQEETTETRYIISSLKANAGIVLPTSSGLLGSRKQGTLR